MPTPRSPSCPRPLSMGVEGRAHSKDTQGRQGHDTAGRPSRKATPRPGRGASTGQTGSVRAPWAGSSAPWGLGAGRLGGRREAKGCPSPPGRVPAPLSQGPRQAVGTEVWVQSRSGGRRSGREWGSWCSARGGGGGGGGGQGSSTAQCSRETGARPRAWPSPRHLVPTHHHQNPEVGVEVAGLGGFQLEEVHADDGEHDHEEPLGGRGGQRCGGLGCIVGVPGALTVVTRPSRMRAPGRWGPRADDVGGTWPQTHLDPRRVLFTKTGGVVPVPMRGALRVPQKARLDRSRGQRGPGQAAPASASPSRPRGRSTVCQGGGPAAWRGADPRGGA